MWDEAWGHSVIPTNTWQWDHLGYVNPVGYGPAGQRVPKPLVLSSKSAGIPRMMGMWQWDHQDYVSPVGQGKCCKRGAKTPTFVLKIHREDGGWVLRKLRDDQGFRDSVMGLQRSHGKGQCWPRGAKTPLLSITGKTWDAPQGLSKIPKDSGNFGNGIVGTM